MNDSKRTLSEEAILEEWKEIQAAQQNPARFAVLYNRYFESIYLFVFKRCGEEDLAGELCSKVFVKAMQKLTQYQFKGVPFSAWLYRIASNEVAQYYRESKKVRIVDIETTNLSEMADELVAEDNESLRQVMLKVLDELPLNDMHLIEMRFFEKRPFKEIAAILEISESNAKVKTYRLLEKMKKKILAKS